MSLQNGNKGGFTMLIIHAAFQVKADQETEFLKEIQPLIKASRAEEGNLSYDLLKDTENAGAYTMVETWKDMDAVKAHNQTDHFTAFTQKHHSIWQHRLM
jgi:quinol monooxygenase YgiN